MSLKENDAKVNIESKDIATYSWISVQFLAHIDLEVGPKDRVGLSINQWNVFALKFGDLRDW